MVDEGIDAGFPLVRNQGVLGKLLKKSVIARERELKVGKSKMRFCTSYSGLQSLVSVPGSVL
jgi:hypothetical protein